MARAHAEGAPRPLCSLAAVLSALALLALQPATRAQSTPSPAPPAAPVCLPVQSGSDEIWCSLPSGNVVIQGLRQKTVEIICDEDKALNCSELPPLSPWGDARSPSQLSVRECALLSPLARCAAALGARSAALRTLALDIRNELRAEHVAGLDGVQVLWMFYADAQHSIPLEALKALPALQTVRLRNACVRAPRRLGGLRRLQLLELSNNRIETLAEGAFQLDHLQELQIWGNLIENITAEHFKGLRSLETLDLSSNRLTALGPRAVALPRLRRLALGDNWLRRVHHAALRGLPRLEVIEACNNNVPLHLSPLSLSNLPSLLEIKLDNSQISSLPVDLLVNSSRLRFVSLRGNALQVLPAALFRSQRALAVLDLSGNQLAAPAHALRSLAALTLLNLDDNRIQELSEDIFAGLLNLKTVKLNNNCVRPARLRLPAALRALHLSNNSISHFPSCWGNALKQLTVLNLSRNEIVILNDTDMQLISKNTTVDLRHNYISSVNVSEVSTSATSILLDGNPLQCDCRLYALLRRRAGGQRAHADAARCAGPPPLQGELLDDVNPEILTCSIHTDCPDKCSCEVRPSTKHLELTCSSLPISIPHPMKYGYALYGTKLALTTAPASLQLPSHVDTLIVSGLNLRGRMIPIPSSVFHVDLTQNGQTEIPVELLKQNMTFRLSGNPFFCDCSHKDAVRILQSYKFKVLDQAAVRCADGGSPWVVSVSRLCAARDALRGGGALAAAATVALVLVGLYWRYSTQIKMYLYSFEKLRWMVTQDDIDQNKKYDAFISFSHKDEKFVAEKLVPVLESGARPFRLCVHYRDWVVGEWIPTQIETSVAQSRRTVIVLSRCFIESVWGIMEFRVAHKRAQEEKMTRVIVILLEDAPHEADLDAELRAFLAINTYLEWGDPWFWEKLRFALAGGRVAARRVGRSIRC